MLVIHNSQINILRDHSEAQFREDMTEYLRNMFPALHDIPSHILDSHLARALERARSYGLRSARDICRYLNICVLYGWEFDALPENAWMRAILTDAAVSSPSGRLHRLVDRCLERARVQQHNRESRHAHA
jgi:hypothetical protein